MEQAIAAGSNPGETKPIKCNLPTNKNVKNKKFEAKGYNKNN